MGHEGQKHAHKQPKHISGPATVCGKTVTGARSFSKLKEKMIFNMGPVRPFWVGLV